MAKVLLVEDHQDSRELISAILEIDGYVVELAARGEDGVRMAVEQPPDMIILDISLAGEIDGIETLRRLRAHSALDHVPVYALTAHTTLSDRQAIASAGFDKYLTKPIVDLNGFRREISEALVKGRRPAST
ncbi:MAG: response regulator [Pyrinomonadaceae bacterium]